MADIDEQFILNEEALDDLYAWIDTIPLSRPKKNIARDFSDGGKLRQQWSCSKLMPILYILLSKLNQVWLIWNAFFSYP